MPRVSHDFPRKLALVPSAPADAGAVRSVDVNVSGLQDGTLELGYVLAGDLHRLRIPRPRASRHADELWKHTCFEAFIGVRGSDSYFELNVAPSTERAVYSFKSYRQGMAPVNLRHPPRISVAQSTDQLEVDVNLDLRALPGLFDNDKASRPALRVALAAVVEDENGRLSYWALKHAPDKPDFHHPDSFVLEL